jgi:cobalt-zinc-cadmium efflux system outer membrane protein
MIAKPDASTANAECTARRPVACGVCPGAVRGLPPSTRIILAVFTLVIAGCASPASYRPSFVSPQSPGLVVPDEYASFMPSRNIQLASAEVPANEVARPTVQAEKGAGAGDPNTTHPQGANSQGAVQKGSTSLPNGVAAPSEEQAPPPDAPQETYKLSLDQAISMTLTQDPVLRSGLETVNQAGADALTASLFPNPSMLGDILMLPLTHPFTFNNQGGPPQTDYFVGYPIDWFLFGKRAAAMVAASQGIRVAESDYANLVRQRVTETAVAYFDFVEATSLRELALQDVTNLEQLEKATRGTVGVGAQAPVDLQRIQLTLLTSRQTQRIAEATVVTSKAKLRAMLGGADLRFDFEPAVTLDAPLTARPMDVEEAYMVADENRPDIESLRRKVQQAQANLEVERRKAYPLVTPQLGYTRQFQSEINFPNADSWNASLTFSVPLFDRNQGNVAKSSSVVTQTTSDLQAGRVALRSEIEQIVREFRTALTNAIAVAEEQLRLAAQVRDSITSDYQLGGRNLIEVLDAQRNYRDTYRLYITSRANYWRSMYRFSSAIGRQLAP